MNVKPTSSHFVPAGGFVFGTCGKRGLLGPQQGDCDEAYQGTGVAVKVGDGGVAEGAVVTRGDARLGFTTGVQRWQVPEDGIYT